MEQRPDAEARLMLVGTISEMISAIEDPGELLYQVSRAVGEHLQVRRCLFTEIDLENDRGTVRRDFCRDVRSVAGVYRISDYAELTRLELESGRVVVNRDSMVDPRTAANYAKAYEPNGERAYIAIPLLRDGRWVAELWVSDDVPREWSEQDVALLRSVAERVWTAVEKLRVHAALQESEARVRFVGERAEVGYWDWEIPSDHLIWSDVCRRLFDIDADVEISYATFLAFVHPDDRARVDAAVRAALSSPEQPEFDVELRTVRKDGSVRWILSKGSATFEGTVPVRMAGIALDVTRRKTLELEREELLARERRLRADADEASLAKDHFLALLSHELRTPMTTILGWASFLETGVTDPETVRKGIESIEQASRAQARLIDDLLDVSRIVAGKLTLEHKLFDVCDVVRAAVEMLDRNARAGVLEWHLDLGTGPVFMLGDPARIQQVIWNLLSNAVKFTPSGGRVEISVREAGEHAEIRVTDSGIGIEANFLPHVFERFRQAEDGPSRRFGGLGLGLSIVRHITEQHGGTVQVASDGVGSGTTFCVRLPRVVLGSDSAGPAKAERSVRPNALLGIRVLVVDDDAAAREVVAAMLRGYGADVTVAASARDAIRVFESAVPDVLVSDIGMPDEDGYDLIRNVREGGVATAIPAVAVTAYADAKDRQRALEAGYQAHLAKPVEPNGLAATILSILHLVD
jgi:signal transduction histidine kinase/CheY-like chemotaxis protein